MIAGVLVGVGAILFSSGGDEPALPPNDDAAPARLCVVADFVCQSELVEHVRFPPANSPAPTVRSWYRGELERFAPKAGSNGTRRLDDVLVVRLDFHILAESGRYVSPASIGLVVATPATAGSSAVVSPEVLRADVGLVWIPVMPDPFDDQPDLLPELPVLADGSTGDSFPFTAMFDLSDVELAGIVGIAGGDVWQPDSGSNEVTLSSLSPAHAWPEKVASVRQLYKDFEILANFVDGDGLCYVEMHEVGLGFAFTDCHRPHIGEVLGAAQTYSEDIQVWLDACQARYGTTAGIADGVPFTITYAPGAAPDTPDGDRTVNCVARADETWGLWQTPMTAVARG